MLGVRAFLRFRRGAGTGVSMRSSPSSSISGGGVLGLRAGVRLWRVRSGIAIALA